MLMKVNLGCGEKWCDGWVNIDWSWNARIRKHPLTRFWLPSLMHRFNLIDININWPSNLVIHDVRKRLPFDNSTVDCIYTSHVIEHLTKYEATKTLTDCHRILKARGVIRIVVPDLELFASKYVARDYDFYYKNFTYDKSVGDTFADRFLSIFYEKDRTSVQSIRQKIKSSLFSNPYHKWLYDYESLSAILSQIGFEDIERYSPKIGTVPDLNMLEESSPESLYIEAQK